VITYSIGLKNRFRGITVREGMLFEGPAGWAEWSPFLEYDDATCVSWLRAAREAAYDGWPAPVRAAVPVNCTVPAVGPDRAAEIVSQSGCGTAKVKVAEPGQTLKDDIERLEAVREAIGSGQVRIDANGGWSVDEAVRNLKELSRFDLEYVEQPCATVEELAAVRRRTDVLVAADESIRRAEDPLLVKKLDAADIAVLKVQPIGGVRACLDIAEQIGLPVVVSSALETSVGIAAGVALAAALPELPYACGLATVSMFTSEVVAEPLLPVDGLLPVRRVQPDPALLEAAKADAVRTAVWEERMSRVQMRSAG
jgi:O-succinylbenzoate synthase